jgi:beta-glucosidase
MHGIHRPRRVLSIPLPHRESVFAAGTILLLLVIIGLVVVKSWQHARQREREALALIPNQQLVDRALNARVEKLLASMSLQEKIGQLTQYTPGVLTGPDAPKLDYDQLIAEGQIGSLFNVVGAAETNAYQRIAVEKSPHHIPLIFGYDVIHGDRTIFPVPLALSSSFDPDLVEKVSRVSAQEACADGVRWVFSPMVDIARDARWGRITEGAGEDTFLGCALARAYIRGYQGDDLSKPDAVAACVKHFAAYGAPNAGREYNTVDMSELSLRQIYLPPYHAAIDAGAATVMSAFNPLNGVPASADPFTLTTILRHEWNFAGFVVCDYGAVRELMNHGIAENGSVAAEKALSSGVDMDMMSDLYRTRLTGLATGQDPPLSPAVITEAARRVLRVKFALGLFDHPYADEKAPPDALTPEKRGLARQAAAEGIVLLKNSTVLPYAAPTLPLPKNAPRIALIGPLADSAVDMLGSWAASGEPKDVVTLRDALRAHCLAAKTQLLFAHGTDILTDSQDGFDAALTVARQSDVVVLALGESGALMTGESSSVTRLDLPGNQEALLEQVTALGKPTVLVLFTGRPLAVKWAANHVPAIVEAWYPGMEAGNAVADVLFGDTNPSGKITATFPRAVGQEPIFYNQLPTGRPAVDVDLDRPPESGAEKYFSRYIDETNAPLYPFGFGLSYTTFSYGPLSVSLPKISAQKLLHPPTGRLFPPPKDVHIGVDLKNTGKVAGTEIAQLYIRTTGGTVEEPVRELKGFQRVTLQPGETKHLDFTLGREELQHYDVNMQRTIEPAHIDVWVGGSSLATQTASFEIVP